VVTLSRNEIQASAELVEPFLVQCDTQMEEDVFGQSKGEDSVYVKRRRRKRRKKKKKKKKKKKRRRRSLCTLNVWDLQH
jgi:hypothetical protein